MTATAHKRESGFAAHPGYEVGFEPCPKRLRVVFNGETVVDSTAAMLLRETRHAPVYYFPRADMRLDLLSRSDHSTFCPFKGDAAYWTLAVGGRCTENAVWSYEDPFAETAEIRDYMALYWDRMDAWYEEDEEVFVHARDPHVRIDVLRSARPVRVILAGRVLAETSRALFLFETGLPTRYYIPRDDVAMDFLEPSATRSACPYKGESAYFSARVGDRFVENAAWCYAEPLAECAAIAGHLCFYPGRVDELTVDGESAP